jgi:hypothetical protein
MDQEKLTDLSAHMLEKYGAQGGDFTRMKDPGCFLVNYSSPEAVYIVMVSSDFKCEICQDIESLDL